MSNKRTIGSRVEAHDQNNDLAISAHGLAKASGFLLSALGVSNKPSLIVCAASKVIVTSKSLMGLI